MAGTWSVRAGVLAGIAGTGLLALPVALVAGVPPLGFALAAVCLLAAAGLACAVTALAKQERHAFGPLAMNAVLLALPGIVFALSRILLEAPCPTC